MRTLVQATIKQVGQTITVKGWVQSRRDHGGLIFIDIRDHTGIAQLVIQPETAEAFKIAEQLRDEFVIEASGEVRERAEDLKNPHLETGSIEVKVNMLSILNRSEALPIQIHNEPRSASPQDAAAPASTCRTVSAGA
jgi:aspartyl-tRNA synthetase